MAMTSGFRRGVNCHGQCWHWKRPSTVQGLPWSRILAGWSMLPSQYPITTVWLTAWPSKHPQMILSGCQAHCQLQCYCASLQAGIALAFFASVASNTSSITFSGMY